MAANGWSIGVARGSICFYAEIAAKRIVGTANVDVCETARPFVCQARCRTGYCANLPVRYIYSRTV